MIVGDGMTGPMRKEELCCLRSHLYDLTVGGISRISETDIRIRRIEVGNLDTKKPGQAIDVGFGVGLTTAPSAVANDDDPRCHWGEKSCCAVGTARFATRSDFEIERGELPWTALGEGETEEMGACGTSSLKSGNGEIATFFLSPVVRRTTFLVIGVGAELGISPLRI